MLPKDIPTNAATAAIDDYVHLNGTTNKSRKFLASLWSLVNSPTFTGVPKAPTPDGSQAKALVTVDYLPSGPVPAATTAVLVTLMQTTLYPVGEILITHRTGNPNTWLGFGTWVAYGAGKVLIGLDTGDPTCDTIDETGGTKTHTLIEANLPLHAHSVPVLSGTTTNAGGHFHELNVDSSTAATSASVEGLFKSNNNGLACTKATVSYQQKNNLNVDLVKTTGDHTHTFSTVANTTGNGAGTATAVNHQNPFITVAFWRRTA